MVTVTLLLWNLLRLYPGDRWTPIRLGNYFAPWVSFLLLPLLLVALLGRRRWLIGAVLILVLVFGGRYGTMFLPRRPPDPSVTTFPQIRVLTFNLHILNRDAPALVELIRREQPDLIALQEVHREMFAALWPELSPTYPHCVMAETEGLPLALLSRYPLTGQAVPEGAWRALRATVDTPDGPITVWNLHLSLSFQQHGWESQYHTLQLVAHEVDGDSWPVILVGDLNTTDHTASYRLIASRLVDAHRAVGWGPGFTFPSGHLGLGGLGPLLRLDFVFVSDHFVPETIRSDGGAYGSDHRPLIVHLRLVRGGFGP